MLRTFPAVAMTVAALIAAGTDVLAQEEPAPIPVPNPLAAEAPTVQPDSYVLDGHGEFAGDCGWADGCGGPLVWKPNLAGRVHSLLGATAGKHCPCHAHGMWMEAHGCRFLGNHHQRPVVPRSIDHHHPDLFYNFWVPPMSGGSPAQLYLCPRPVPQLVGWTYYTYQPFMPHEMLYAHKRTYYRYFNGGRGMNRTSVKWYSPKGVRLMGMFYDTFRIPR